MCTTIWVDVGNYGELMGNNLSIGNFKEEMEIGIADLQLRLLAARNTFNCLS